MEKLNYQLQLRKKKNIYIAPIYLYIVNKYIQGKHPCLGSYKIYSKRKHPILGSYEIYLKRSILA